MKKLIGAFFVFVFFLVAMPTFAQYVVKQGETLWGIAEKNLDAAIAWEKIYNSNPFLQDRGITIDKKGRKIVKILPGEILLGVTQAGVVETQPAVRVVWPVEPPEADSGFPWWLIWLGLLAFLVFIGAIYNLSKKNATEWRPVVPGGVRDDAHAASLLQAARRNGGTLIQGTQRKVRLSGPWLTKHAGILIPIPHRYVQERAYCADFLMSNGMRRQGYMLQGCGNDVSSGRWYVPLRGASVLEGWGDENETTHPTAPSASTTPIPTTVSIPEAKVEEPVISPNSEGMKLTKLQISREKGLNIEGDFSLDVKNLMKLVNSFKK